MTKKSMARTLRDSQMKDARSEANGQIKNNTIYDDFRATYTALGMTLASYADAYNQLNIKEIQKFFTKQQQDKVAVLSQTYITDIHNFKEDLFKLGKVFEGKTGGEYNLDLYIHNVDVINQYAELNNRMVNILDSGFRNIAAEVAIAQQVAYAETHITREQDPSVVTDVQVKEMQ